MWWKLDRLRKTKRTMHRPILHNILWAAKDILVWLRDVMIIFLPIIVGMLPVSTVYLIKFWWYTEPKIKEVLTYQEFTAVIDNYLDPAEKLCWLFHYLVSRASSLVFYVYRSNLQKTDSSISLVTCLRAEVQTLFRDRVYKLR